MTLRKTSSCPEVRDRAHVIAKARLAAAQVVRGQPDSIIETIGGFSSISGSSSALDGAVKSRTVSRYYRVEPSTRKGAYHHTRPKAAKLG